MPGSGSLGSPPQAPLPRPPSEAVERRAVLLVTCLSSFLAPFMGSALNLAIPAIGVDLRASALTLNGIVGAYLVASAAFLLPFGRWADLHGRRRVFVAGALAHALSSGAAALAWSPASLVVFRFLQGVGGALLFATGLAILSTAYPAADRGRVLGINTSAVYAGLSLGPVVGGLLTQQVGWRSIFVLNALAGLAVVVVARLRIAREPRGFASGRFDWAGAALYATSLTALLGGASLRRSLPGAGWLPVLGAAGLIGFVLHERFCRQPILDVGLFANLGFAFSNLAALIHYSATFAVAFLLSIYLQGIRGFDARTAGLVLLVQPVLMALVSPFAGRLSDRAEPRRVASAGMAITFLGLVLFAFVDRSTPLDRLIAGLVLMGVGFGLFSSPNTNAVMSSVETRQYGVAAATLGTMRMVGQAASLALVALVFARFVGSAGISQESAPLLLAAMKASFVLFAGLCAAGTAASLARGRVRR